MIAALFLSASLTFTATATGVGKGTPLEFVFADRTTDRDYETMFLLDEPVADFCRRLECAGLPRGMPTDAASCRLWPVGCPLSFSPSLDKYVETSLPDDLPVAPPVYTGGLRDKKGNPIAATEMPSSVFSVYTLAQSPIVHDGIFEQGRVYGCHLAAMELKKGTKVTFTVTWNAEEMPRHLDVTVASTNAAEVLSLLRKESENRELDVTVAFDPEMMVSEARAAALALSRIESHRIKLNGRADGSLFYRAFVPESEWTNRAMRLVQPFELTVSSKKETLVFIDEDWSVEGDDPKLTPKEIPFADVAKYPKTDTCFVFVASSERLKRIMESVNRVKGTSINNWYVFPEPGL